MYYEGVGKRWVEIVIAGSTILNTYYSGIKTGWPCFIW